MANNSKILTAEQELALRKPIDEYVGGIQKKIDALREDGTAKVLSYNNTIDAIKRDRTLSKTEKSEHIAEISKELSKAKAVEAKNKAEIDKLIADAEAYLKAHFEVDYFNQDVPFFTISAFSPCSYSCDTHSATLHKYS